MGWARVFGSALPAVLALGAACAAAQDATVPEPLAAPFAAAFAGAFDDPAPALAAWKSYGGAVLATVEDEVYPPVAYERFRRQALERVRRARASRPGLSPELLSFVALDGLTAQPGREVALAVVRDRAGKAPRGVMLTSIAGVETSSRRKTVSRVGGYHGAPAEFAIPVLDVPELRREAVDAADHRALAAHDGPIVLDLRGNAGGLLAEVPRLAGLFLSPGRTVLVMETKAGRRETLRTDSGTDPIVTGKVLVLIDEGTDAGALALAAALREHDRAKVAGKRTGQPRDGIERLMPQRICPPPVNECALRLPVGRLLAPSGRTLNEAVELDYPADWEDPDAGRGVVAQWLAEGR